MFHKLCGCTGESVYASEADVSVMCDLFCWCDCVCVTVTTFEIFTLFMSVLLLEVCI
jgi:hypothetical protein